MPTLSEKCEIPCINKNSTIGGIDLLNSRGELDDLLDPDGEALERSVVVLFLGEGLYVVLEGG